jgi:hypothetical protein
MEKPSKDNNGVSRKNVLKKSRPFSPAMRRVSRYVIEIVYCKVRLKGKPRYVVPPDCNPELW